MREKITRGIFWIISVGSLLSSVLCLINKQMLVYAFVMLIVGIIINPCILDKILMIVGVKATVYPKSLLIAMNFLGSVIALVIAYVIFKLTIDENVGENDALQIFELILKFVVYIIYLAILFVNQNANKIIKYIIFGFIYLICVLISFIPQSFNLIIMNFLNFVTNSNLDLESYDLLTNGILIPIREAILTYIIFDTVIGSQNKKQEMNQIQSIENIIDNESIRQNEVNNNSMEYKLFDVKVSDKSSLDKTEYNIYVHKQ